MTKLFFFFFFFYTLLLHAKPVELVFWHAMAGSLGDEVKLLANDFNHSQNDFFIRPIYKGNYTETLTSFAAAFRAHQAPALVQVFEVGTTAMLSPPGIIKPVDELMEEQKLSLPKEDFIQAARELYSSNGKLMAMPFNLSAPVIFYNQDILKKVGYDAPPKTWEEMEILAEKIKKAGYGCTYTSAYPGWILVESYLAIHGLPLATMNPDRVVLDTPALLDHFERLKRWQDTGYFRYGGKVDEATVLFTGGICALFSQSSGAYNSLSSLVPFHLGVAVMPLDTKTSQIRYANVVGGAAVWVVSGQSSRQYQGIAQFLAFIAKPEIQKRWHEHTGYLPIGLSGVYADILKTSKHPVVKLAKNDLEDNASKPRQVIGPQNQIRSIVDEVLEALFAHLVTAKQALEEASLRSNHVMLRFARNTHLRDQKPQTETQAQTFT